MCFAKGLDVRKSNNDEKKPDFTQDIRGYLHALKGVIDGLNIDQIQIVIEKIIEAYQNERFIFVFGNGGSASTASHLVTDFNKGVSGKLQKKFRVICGANKKLDTKTGGNKQFSA